MSHFQIILLHRHCQLLLSRSLSLGSVAHATATLSISDVHLFPHRLLHFFSAFSLPCLASPYLTQKHPPHKGAGVTQVPKVVQQALLPSPQRHNYAQATATLFLFLVVVPRLKNIHHFCQMSIKGAKSGQVPGTASLPSLI